MKDNSEGDNYNGQEELLVKLETNEALEMLITELENTPIDLDTAIAAFKGSKTFKDGHYDESTLQGTIFEDLVNTRIDTIARNNSTSIITNPIPNCTRVGKMLLMSSNEGNIVIIPIDQLIFPKDTFPRRLAELDNLFIAQSTNSKLLVVVETKSSTSWGNRGIGAILQIHNINNKFKILRQYVEEHPEEGITGYALIVVVPLNMLTIKDYLRSTKRRIFEEDYHGQLIALPITIDALREGIQERLTGIRDDALENLLTKFSGPQNRKKKDKHHR